ncbi:MalY/PatB family protein [Paenibacillus aurantius]|uniref:cysteine-S-conjugate beta-lyase n=1 Tax=Paenibacillus aurantius TaxID=2918900 RepID=A0AA96LC80_9BACL|nr:MalY/PatB family protein [Paenibacillus aurantius]WNQ10478.1 MalY/PatB family protein [Paenibacillus aurantius]
MKFDNPINRKLTASEKWDQAASLFGASDILPMWVADMDFAAPEPVLKALHSRVDHGVLGYTYPTDSYKASLAGWMRTRHGYPVEPEWIQHCPGVVPAMGLIVQAFTEPGDAVVVQSPVYPPFFKVVDGHGRRVALNPLKLGEDGGYTMDFEDLEKQLSGGDIRMFLLCSPHNPVGRVWSREELTRLEELLSRYNVLVVSDEIHADLVHEPGSHIPYPSLSADAASRTFLCTAPSKTFNIAGLNTANIIIPNAGLRNRFRKEIQRFFLGSITPLGMAAAEAAYREGSEWLDALLPYVKGNLDYIRGYVGEHLPEISVNIPQGTYLLWMDFRRLGMNDRELARFLADKAGLGLNAGTAFGPGGEGFMRLNAGCPRSMVEEAMRRLHKAMEQWRETEGQPSP